MRKLVGEEATSEAVLNALEEEQYDLVHFAGHAWYDREDAYLVCHDQQVLKARDLQSFLARSRPPFVFLNSHWTAFVPPGVQGGEVQARLGPGARDSSTPACKGSAGSREPRPRPASARSSAVWAPPPMTAPQSWG